MDKRTKVYYKFQGIDLLIPSHNISRDFDFSKWICRVWEKGKKIRIYHFKRL